MNVDHMRNPVNVQSEERRARAERILDAAAELVLRHGYRRVTIEDVAQRAGIGKGTIYLHWKNREALFFAMLARDSLVLIDEQIELIRRDPVEILPHRAVRSILQRSMERPLLSAMLTKDAEVLGKLVTEGTMASIDAGCRLNAEYLALLRARGLVRTDLSPEAQLYALEVIGGGFTLMDPWLPEPIRLPMAVKADTLARMLRQVLEPEGSPDPRVLAEVAPRVIELYRRIARTYDPTNTDVMSELGAMTDTT